MGIAAGASLVGAFFRVLLLFSSLRAKLFFCVSLGRPWRALISVRAPTHVSSHDARIFRMVGADCALVCVEASKYVAVAVLNARARRKRQNKPTSARSGIINSTEKTQNARLASLKAKKGAGEYLTSRTHFVMVYYVPPPVSYRILIPLSFHVVACNDFNSMRAHSLLHSTAVVF